MLKADTIQQPQPPEETSTLGRFNKGELADLVQSKVENKKAAANAFISVVGSALISLAFPVNLN